MSLQMHILDEFSYSKMDEPLYFQGQQEKMTLSSR